MRNVRLFPRLLTSVFLLGLAACESGEEPAIMADTVLTNGRIYTVEEGKAWVEAVAIKDGVFVAVGEDEDIRAHVGQTTKVVDLEGRMAMPGIIDGHTHPVWGAAKELYECNFPFSATPDDIVAELKKCVERNPDAQWITGGQWDSDFFKNHDIASPKALLDAVSGDKAVYFADDSGHNGWVNSKALELAGIGIDTKDPENGTIVRDRETGEPNGVLFEDAVTLIEAIIPDRSPEEYLASARKAVEIANGYGITGMKNANARPYAMQALKTLDEMGGLTMNMAVAITTPYGHREVPLDYDLIEQYRQTYASTHVLTDFVKIFMDGVPTASRTAAMLAPYLPDDHGHVTSGSLHLSQDLLNQDLAELDRRGFTVKMHTAGDRSVRVALNAIEATRKANGPSGLRHELAHAGYVDEADMMRFTTLNAVADVSPVLWHPSPIITSVVNAVGPRGEKYWPIRSFLDNGSMVAAGSDWPAAVPTMSPWVGVEAFVTRRDPYGKAEGQLWPEQAIQLAEAIRIYTLNGAKALKIDDKTGTIRVGKNADLIVLDRNLFEAPIDDVGDTKVLITMFEGRIVQDHRSGER